MQSTAPNLTILLTLKGRTSFTYRWMKYMDAMRCPFPILISDGGEEDQALESHLRDKGNYPNLDYEYVRYPYDADYMAYYKKVYDSVSRMNTEYMFFADNDDFLLLDNMKESLDFLEANPVYSSCGGRLIVMELVPNRASGTDDGLICGRAVFNHRRPGTDVDSDDKKERVLRAVHNHYGSLWYHIVRTDVAKTAFGHFIEQNMENLNFMEPSFAAATAGMGKIHCGATPFYVRQLGTSDFSGATGREKFNILLTMFRPFWSDNVAKAVSFIAAAAGETDNEEVHWNIKEGLADMCLYEIQARLVHPYYKQVARRLGIDQSALWRMLRDSFLKIRKAIYTNDLFFKQRRNTRRLISENPSLGNIVDFLENYRP